VNVGTAARAALAALALCLAGPGVAQLPVPRLTSHVVDRTATLSAAQAATLEASLAAFEARKGSQLAVLIVATTAPEAIEPFALRVAEQWKLGRKKVDDGAILVIARDERALRIEVGYGLEGALNDATAKRILDEVITPRFKAGDFNGGITAGMDRIIAVIDGEALPAPAAAAAGAGGFSDIRQYAPAAFVLALIIGGILRAVLGRLPGSLATGGVVGGVTLLLAGAWPVALVAGGMALVVALVGGGLGGFGVGGMRGGYRTGSSGTGGGFGGGGGAFGGGGASGRW
jgi:uncharacterized protein